MGIFDSITNKVQGYADQAKNTANNVKANFSANTGAGSSLYQQRKDNGSLTQYDLTHHSFPSDITNSADYGGNYVIFYINVNVDSKILKDKSVATIPDNMVQRDRGGLIAVNQKMFGDEATAAQKAGFVGLNAAGQALSGAGAGLLAKGPVGAGIGAAANAGPAAIGIGAAMTQTSTISRAQKRLKTAIALYIPNQLSIRYGMQWSEEDTFAYQAAAGGAEAAMKAFATGGSAGVGQGAAAGAPVIAAMGLKSDKQGAAASAATGLAANPKKEQVFKGVDYRTFQFDYQFFPRDASEAANVMEIINAFKLHMHPEFKDANEFLYLYPSEFDVEYWQNGGVNPFVHRHTSCVLTEMNVNYTPNGQFNTFANGMPTQINITLQFRELSLLTKDKIKDGL
jgi:hypothetical protein